MRQSVDDYLALGSAPNVLDKVMFSNAARLLGLPAA
jgi:predicted TIM-barrel fold metal-dependent hydrolase